MGTKWMSVGAKGMSVGPKWVPVGAKWPQGDGEVVNAALGHHAKRLCLPALAAPELRRARRCPAWAQVTPAGAPVGAKWMSVGAKGMSVGPKWVPVGGKRPQGDDEVVNVALGHHAKRLCFTSPGGT